MPIEPTGYDKEKEELIQKMTYYIHNGSLMLDDIQDSSELRRGVPANHKIYGIPRTAVAIEYLVARACQMVEDTDNIEFAQLTCNAMRWAFAGQGMELYWRDNHMCPTLQEYIQTAYGKTGFIFVYIVNALNMLSTGKPIDVHRLAVTISVYFQINDDYQNLNNKVYHDSKGFCEDITEGKYSFPIVHAVRNFPKEGKEIDEIMKMRTYDVEIKKRCLELIEKCGSFEYTRKILRQLKSEINTEIAKLDPNPLLANLVESANFINI